MRESAIRNALSGTGAHVETAELFDGFDWQMAGERPGNSPHSVWQLLSHMVYWQEYVLKYFRGETPKAPEHAAESWPNEPAPESRELWEETLSLFLTGLAEAQEEADRDLDETGFDRQGRTRAELLLVIASHNSYHGGQAVFLRRMLGAWPPPSGGDTW